MPAACLEGYEEAIRDNLVWFGRWWMNLHKRSCCWTWAPRKINMEFAKDPRNIFYSRRIAVCRKRNFDQPPYIYTYISYVYYIYIYTDRINIFDTWVCPEMEYFPKWQFVDAYDGRTLTKPSLETYQSAWLVEHVLTSQLTWSWCIDGPVCVFHWFAVLQDTVQRNMWRCCISDSFANTQGEGTETQTHMLLVVEIFPELV